MNAFEEEKNRQIIPRWFPFSQACMLVPLAAFPSNWIRDFISSEDFKDKRESWKRYLSIPYAIDFIASALIRGEINDHDVRIAAKAASESSKNSPQFVNEIVDTVLQPRNAIFVRKQLSRFDLSTEIRTLKKLSYRSLYSPLLHIDLAYYYVLLNQLKQAERHMDLALALGKHNSFILRAAARYYLHVDNDPTRSIWILRNNQMSSSDPAVLSADLAITEAFDLKSPLKRMAKKKLFEFDLHPWFLSELAGTVGTLELRSGSTKRAKRILQMALQCPTENTLAQARWLSSTQSIDLLIDDDRLPPAAFEAEMIQHVKNKQFESALNSARDWMILEPYSERAGTSASFIASVSLENFNTAEKISKEAMQTNPQSFSLKNNLIFALASKGEIPEAESWLGSIDISRLTVEDKSVFKATSGLVQFRKGNFQAGRAAYQEALSDFLKSKDLYRGTLASLFWAQEEMIANSEGWQEMVIRALKNTNHPGIIGSPLEKRLRNAVKN